MFLENDDKDTRYLSNLIQNKKTFDWTDTVRRGKRSYLNFKDDYKQFIHEVNYKFGSTDIE